MDKNELIALHCKMTREKRKSQSCHTYQVKIDKSHFNELTSHTLKMMFLEAKWFYNYILTQDVFNFDYKTKEVQVKVKDHFEIRKIQYLSAQMKQGIIEKIKSNIGSLSSLKNNGHKIGKLKFKTEIKSIPLKQYRETHSGTYRILNKSHIYIQKIKQHLRVNGISQIPIGSDIANANLIHRNGDYYLSITTYQNREPILTPNNLIGIDFGLKNQLTLSNGVSIKYSVPISNKLKKLQKRLSKKQLHSKNWRKAKLRVDKEYEKLTNIKGDIKNKIVHSIKANYSIVCYQNDNIKGWQNLCGLKSNSTSIGGLMATLKQRVHTPVEVDRWYPSTKTCSVCGNKQDMFLDQRTYHCQSCDNTIDRDHNSAINIENEGLKQLDVPMVHREFKPMEIEPLLLQLNNIPYVKASSVKEVGSLKDGVAHKVTVPHIKKLPHIP